MTFIVNVCVHVCMCMRVMCTCGDTHTHVHEVYDVIDKFTWGHIRCPTSEWKDKYTSVMYVLMSIRPGIHGVIFSP